MKTKIMLCSIVLLLFVFTGSAFGAFEGYSNTFYGQLAGNITGGDDDADTFIGVYAGYSNTGKYNTFLGLSAGYANTTASYNTFLGFSAGMDSTTGNYNTFVGDRAGYSNTGGLENTFVGAVSGYHNTGNYNTFVGMSSGVYNTTGYYNAFLGNEAGYANTTGTWNTFVGAAAGKSNIIGNFNTFVGMNAGGQNNGSGNVFLGNQTGYNEKDASNKLYIDNSETTTPLIYGEFDNNILTINGNFKVVNPNSGLIFLTDVTTDNTTKGARMMLNHYSNSQLPVYLFGAASTSTNNYVALGGGNAIGNAATQIDLYTAPNTTTLVGTPRLTIIGNGNVGIGTQTPSHPLQMAGGAYTNGTSWIDVSSREYKDNIEALSTEEALEAIQGLNPVKYAYKADRSEQRVGFIAEEVPELVATKDRKGLSPMDIVAVLTRVVQEQQKTIKEQQEIVLKQNNSMQEQQTLINTLLKKMTQLESKMEVLQTGGIPPSILSLK